MIEIELPDGSILEIETDNEDEAVSAAKSYLQKNPMKQPDIDKNGMTPLPPEPQFQDSEQTQEQPGMIKNAMNAGSGFIDGLKKGAQETLDFAVNAGAEASSGVQRGLIGVPDVPVNLYNMVAPLVGLPKGQTLTSMIQDATNNSIASKKGTYLGDNIASDIIGTSAEFYSGGGLSSKIAAMSAKNAQAARSINANPGTVKTRELISNTLKGGGPSAEAKIAGIAGVGAGGAGSVIADKYGEEYRVLGEMAGGAIAPASAVKAQTKTQDSDLIGAILKGDHNEVAKIAQIDRDVLKILDDEELRALAPISVTSTNPQMAQTEGAYSAISGSEAQRVKIGFHQALTKKVSESTEKLSGFSSPLDKSKHYREEHTDLISALRSEAGTYFKKSKNLIPKDERLGASSAQKLVAEKVKNLGGESSLLHPSFKDYFSKMMKGGGDDINPLSVKTDGLTNTKKNVGPTFDAVDTLRANIGKSMKPGLDNPFPGMDTVFAGKMYEALTDDLESFIGKKYPDLLGDFQQGKKIWHQAKLEEESAQKLLGKAYDRDVVPKVATDLGKLVQGGKGGKGLSSFDSLMDDVIKEQKMPVIASALGELMAGNARYMKTNDPTKSAGILEYMNKNKSARDSIFKSFKPEEKEKTLNLMRLSDGLAELQANTIKTGASVPIIQQTNDKAGFLSKIMTNLAGPIGQGTASKLGFAPAGQKIAELIKGGTDNVALANKMLADPVFRLRVFDAAEKKSKGEKYSATKKLTKSMEDWLKSLPENDQQTVSGIGVINYLMGLQDVE